MFTSVGHIRSVSVVAYARFQSALKLTSADCTRPKG